MKTATGSAVVGNKKDMESETGVRNVVQGPPGLDFESITAAWGSLVVLGEECHASSDHAELCSYCMGYGRVPWFVFELGGEASPVARADYMTVQSTSDLGLPPWQEVSQELELIDLLLEHASQVTVGPVGAFGDRFKNKDVAMPKAAVWITCHGQCLQYTSNELRVALREALVAVRKMADEVRYQVVRDARGRLAFDPPLGPNEPPE